MADITAQKLESTADSGRIFLGRRRYLDEFSDMLRELVMPSDQIDSADDLPHIFLISGQGGSGKSHLLEEMYRIALRGQQDGWCQVPPIIRLDETAISPQADRERIDALTVASYLHKKLAGDYLPRNTNNNSTQSISTGNVEASNSLVGVGVGIRQYYIAPGASYQESADDRKLRLVETIEAINVALRGRSKVMPICVFIDTYELVDVVDQQLRTIYLDSGAQVVWVIAGRNYLVEDYSTAGRQVRGYRTRLGSRLHDYAHLELTAEDVRDYFTALTEPISEDVAAALLRVTAGNALALRLAAQLYREGKSLVEIASLEASPLLRQYGAGKDAPVYRMIQKILWYASHEDKLSLYTIALLRPANAVRLMEVVLPRSVGQSVRDRLEQLASRYEFVLADRYRLHDTATHFLRAWLMGEAQGGGEREMVEHISRTATDASLALLQAATAEHAEWRVEQLMDEYDWGYLLEDYLYHKLWLDPRRGSEELFLALGLTSGYSYFLTTVLCEFATSLNPRFDYAITKLISPLRRLEEIEPPYYDKDFIDYLLRQVEKAEVQNPTWYPGVDCVAEAKAVLYWQMGRLNDPGDYMSRMDELEELDPDAQVARIKDVRTAAISLYRQGTATFPDIVGLQVDLAEAYDRAFQLEAAIDCYSEAIRIDPTNPSNYKERGVIYLRRNQVDEAIADFIMANRQKGMETFAAYNLARAYATKLDADKTMMYLRLTVSDNTGYKELLLKDLRFSKLRESNASFAREITCLASTDLQVTPQ